MWQDLIFLTIPTKTIKKELLAAVEHDEQKVREAEQEKINLNVFLTAIRECTDLK